MGAVRSDLGRPSRVLLGYSKVCVLQEDMCPATFQDLPNQGERKNNHFLQKLFIHRE